MVEIGISGRPSSGKSSFFKAATLIDVKISPVPFTTIEPNVGITYVTAPCVCKEFNVRCKPREGACINGVRFIPIKIWDLPGIVPGAHLGRGLGLKFLDDVRQASALIHVVDFSGLTNEEGNPTSGYDPAKDIEFLEDEINKWFASIISKAIQKIGRLGSTSELVEVLTQQLSGLQVTRKHVQETLNKVSITDVENFSKKLREISKPLIIAANKIDLKSSQENFERLKGKYKNIIPTSAEAEIALKKAASKGLIEYSGFDGFKITGPVDEKQKKALEFIQEQVINKYGSTGVLECLNKAVFDVLGHIVVYPVEDENKLSDKSGNVLPDAFLMPPGSTALDLAFKVHTEIGQNFICAIDGRTKKRLGKEYLLKNGDVIKIVAGR